MQSEGGAGLFGPGAVSAVLGLRPDGQSKLLQAGRPNHQFFSLAGADLLAWQLLPDFSKFFKQPIGKLNAEGEMPGACFTAFQVEN